MNAYQFHLVVKCQCFLRGLVPSIFLDHFSPYQDISVAYSFQYQPCIIHSPTGNIEVQKFDFQNSLLLDSISEHVGRELIDSRNRFGVHIDLQKKNMYEYWDWYLAWLNYEKKQLVTNICIAVWHWIKERSTNSFRYAIIIHITWKLRLQTLFIVKMEY